MRTTSSCFWHGLCYPHPYLNNPAPHAHQPQCVAREPLACVAAQVPLPACDALTAAAAGYARSAQPDQAGYYEDLACAHRAAGLLHEHESAHGHR